MHWHRSWSSSHHRLCWLHHSRLQSHWSTSCMVTWSWLRVEGLGSTHHHRTCVAMRHAAGHPHIPESPLLHESRSPSDANDDDHNDSNQNDGSNDDTSNASTFNRGGRSSSSVRAVAAGVPGVTAFARSATGGVTAGARGTTASTRVAVTARHVVAA